MKHIKILFVIAAFGLFLPIGKSQAQTVGKWTVKPVAAVSFLTHDFTTGTNEAGTGPLLGAGIGAFYASSIPVGAAFVANMRLASAGIPDSFGTTLLLSVSNVAFGPGLLWIQGDRVHYLVQFGGKINLLRRNRRRRKIAATNSRHLAAFRHNKYGWKGVA